MALCTLFPNGSLLILCKPSDCSSGRLQVCSLESPPRSKALPMAGRQMDELTNGTVPGVKPQGEHKELFGMLNSTIVTILIFVIQKSKVSRGDGKVGVFKQRKNNRTKDYLPLFP